MKILSGKSVIAQMVRDTAKAAFKIGDSVKLEINVWTHCHTKGELEPPNIDVRVWRSDTESSKHFPDLKQAHDYLCSIFEQSAKES